MKMGLAFFAFVLGCQGTNAPVLTPLSDLGVSDGPIGDGPLGMCAQLNQNCGPSIPCCGAYICSNLTGVLPSCAEPLGGFDMAGADQAVSTTWSLLPSITFIDLYGVWGSSATDVWVVGGTPGSTAGNPGVLLHWDGSNWSSATNLVNLLAVSGSYSGSATAVGEYGGQASAIQWSNGSWAAREILGAGTLRGVWQNPIVGIYAVGDSGMIRYSSEPSIVGAWTGPMSGTTNTLFAVWGSSTSDVYIVGAGGTILHTTTGTMGGPGAWLRPTSPFSANLTSVWGSSANDVYIGGEGGAHSIVLHSTDGGNSWTNTQLTAIGSTTATFAVGGRSATDVYAVGRGDIFHSTGNDVWTVQTNPSTGGELRAIWVAPTGEAFAVGRGGLMLRK